MRTLSARARGSARSCEVRRSQITHDRTGEAEEPHGDDRDRQREDRPDARQPARSGSRQSPSGRRRRRRPAHRGARPPARPGAHGEPQQARSTSCAHAAAARRSRASSRSGRVDPTMRSALRGELGAVRDHKHRAALRSRSIASTTLGARPDRGRPSARRGSTNGASRRRPARVRRAGARRRRAACRRPRRWSRVRRAATRRTSSAPASRTAGAPARRRASASPSRMLCATVPRKIVGRCGTQATCRAPGVRVARGEIDLRRRRLVRASAWRARAESRDRALAARRWRRRARLSRLVAAPARARPARAPPRRIGVRDALQANGGDRRARRPRPPARATARVPR